MDEEIISNKKTTLDNEIPCQEEKEEIKSLKSFAEWEAVSNEQSAILNTLPASIALLDSKTRSQ